MNARRERWRIDVGDAFVVLGAALLFISLFVEWYDTDLSAWDVFEALDLVLAGLAIAAVIAVVTGWMGTPAVPSTWLTAIAVAALSIVAAALVNPPPAALAESAGTGAWLGLGGAALLALGAALRIARVSFAIRFEPSSTAAGDWPTDDPGRPRSSVAPSAGSTRETRIMRDD